ncbi:FecR family protein [Aeoliella sp. ICT_H6.2]|uniref:FecR family protein n=1 Tax=Aeoliella straminimaris TaxID=2954799 RepID=A0A9X2JIH6_9BACT|nr:FecR domain-containing protein [Aeoliella straminimaris]MCO6047080.1 FecR family protein [Aeoliella straminimaris]
MKELPQKSEGRISRLDQLLTLQLNGEATQADSDELNRLLQSEPEAISDYVELVTDSSVFRGFSEAASYCAGPGRESEDAGGKPLTLLDRSVRSRMHQRAPLAYIVTAASIFLAVVLLLSRNDDNTTSVAAGGEGGVTNTLVSADRSATVGNGSASRGAEEGVPKAVTGEVATVIRADDVVWAKDNIDVDELTRVSVGQTLHLTSGELELVFDRSVRMRVRGPALLELRSPTEVYSRFGVLSARVGKAGRGFAIETPNGRIVDLGTEFGVAVDEKGSTAVAVFRGAVDLMYGPQDNLLKPSVTRRLVQGQALTMDLDGSMRRLVSYDDSQFPTFRNDLPLEAGRPSSIFTNVSDNIRDGIGAKSYRIVPGGLREDVLAYVDRQHQWNGVDSSGIPSILQGADYIMPFNGDKGRSNLSVEVTVGRPSRLFVFMSPIAKVPEWLTDEFTKTDMQIGLDESGEYALVDGYELARGPGKAIDTKFFVWQRDVDYPTTVVLGSVRQARRGTGYCMYGIAAVPLEVARHYDAKSN